MQMRRNVKLRTEFERDDAPIWKRKPCKTKSLTIVRESVHSIIKITLLKARLGKTSVRLESRANKKRAKRRYRITTQIKKLKTNIFKGDKFNLTHNTKWPPLKALQVSIKSFFFFLIASLQTTSMMKLFRVF